MTMAAKSPGQAVLGRRPKAAPKGTNTHRWEPFTKRIARLKIDPIHTVQNGHSPHDTSDYSHSYFRAALDDWTELNLSTTFTAFAKVASPLCETLPQLLHHADRLFELLVEHIEKRDALAMEPLMSLTAHFAHDLGKEFEKYFARTVSLTVDVAATHEAADAVEWCFTSMAWLFKHLSRMLVPDLRPLLGIMIPYLSHRKEYIARFSAESLVFLLRKAMSQYSRQKTPLTVAIRSLVESVSTEQQGSLGLLMLLVESCLGTEGGLHSAAQNMMQCLLDVVSLLGFAPEFDVLLEGFVVGLAHRTTSDAFEPILNVILSETCLQSETRNSAGIDCCLSLVQAAIGTRKGSRILSWRNMLEALVPILQRQNDIAEERNQRQLVLSISALVLQYAPVNELLPFSTPLLELSNHQGRPTEFFSFCALVADLGRDRFQEFVLPRLQQYILSNYMDDEVGLIYLLQRLHGQGLVGREKEKPGFVRSVEAWDKSVIERVSPENELGLSDECLISIAKASQVIHFPSRPADSVQLSIVLGAVASRSFTNRAEAPNLRQKVSAGWCLEASIGLRNGSRDQLDKSVVHLLHAPEWCYRLRPFLDACSLVMSKATAFSDANFKPTERILNSLTEIMLTSSTSTKISSLKLLQQLGIPDQGQWLSETVALMLELCETNYLPANTRKISMLLRRLPQLQKHAASVSWIQRLIPNFCIGLLPMYYDRTRRDLCSTLAEVLEESPIQDAVLDILCEWLRSPQRSRPRQIPQSSGSSRLSTFECINLNQVRKLTDEAFETFLTSGERMKALAEDDHQLARMQVPENSRELALEVLSAMPALAERRSRVIIPIFASIPFGPTSHDSQPPSQSLDGAESRCPEPSAAEWTFADRRAFVRLIRQFQNPKVLYQCAQVRDILMLLLQNGNLEMRRLALEGLLKWKDPVLQKHEHVFFQLVEEKASNAEIGVMLNAAAEQNPISPEDRPLVLPILLRLLYGSIVGRSGSYGSQEARRKSILRMLFRMDQTEVATFLDIALGSLKNIGLDSVPPISTQVLELNLVPVDQQYGFLRLMLSLLEILHSQFAPFGHRIIDAVIYCTLRSCRQVDHVEAKTGGLHRSIRRTGLHCLELLFRHCPDIEWEAYMPILFLEAISPRLEAMPTETAQAVSVMLRIFSVWSQHESYVHFLLDYDARLPGALWQSLTANSVKPEVQSYILNEILQPLLAYAQKDDQPSAPAQRISVAESDALIQNLALLLKTQPSKGVVEATTSVILALAPLNSQAANSDNILELLLDLLRDGNSKSSPATRGSAVAAVQALLKCRQGPLDDATKERLMYIIAPLYQYFRDQPSRLCLGQIIKLSSTDALTGSVADLCDSLNALSTERLDELDYDRRVQGYEAVKSLAVDAVPPALWRPVVFNLVFFAKDEDFTIRSNALSALKDFIGRASASGSKALVDVVKQGILPVVQTGMTDNSETIRADMVSVFGLLVQGFGQQLGMQDLEPLLVGSDEEASFFNNIMHIQHHRRARAIRRLTSEVEQGKIPASNISKIFLPMLQMFVKDTSTDDSAQSLKGQSIQALSTLLSWIEWKHFKAFFKRAKQELEEEEHVQRTAIKLLMVAAETLTRAWTQTQHPINGDSLQTCLAATLPPQPELEHEVKSQLLAKLADFIHYREEAEMSARLPAATVAVHLIKLVPANETQMLAAPIVLDVANVLRSRSSESRDAARRTLAEVVKLLGPTSLLFVLKEMRTALKRGYQLHVLSYTLHSILVNMSPFLKIGDLDYCLENVVAVIMDDIFGIVGQEKESQDYISGMKEVKSSKSFDSMEILARSASLSHLTLLLDPIVTILTGSLTSKQSRQVDDLLRRVGIGLAQNPAAGEREILTFAFQVIERFYKEKASVPRRSQTQDEANRARFLVKHVSDTKASTAGQTSLSYKIARFAIDNVRSALQKHPELLQPENVAGFLPIIGDALVEAQEDVKVSALRLLSAIIRLQMPELDQNAPVYVLEAVKVVRHANSTNDEAAQAALKLVAAVLRERRSVAIRDQEVAELLRRVSPDLEEPDRQGVTFNFIRAVMSRKYQLPELYDLVDKIGIMMVTNQTRGARDVARGVYVQFLLDYPQSSARWTKQQKFLLKNLQYEYPEGRESVMEAINMLVNKTAGDVSQALIAAFFIPVVLRLANDDNQGCRDFAGALLGQLFKKVAPEKSKALLEPLRSWVNQTENQALTKIGMQAFAILFDAVHDGLDTEVKNIKQSISATLTACDIEGNNAGDLLHRTLELLLKLAETRPAAAFSQGSEEIFKSVRSLVRHRDPRVQADAASIVAAFFRNCKPSNIPKLPLTSTYGLKLDEAGMRDLLRATVHLLKRTEGNRELSNEAVALLAILGRCVEANGLTMPVKGKGKGGDYDDNNADSSNDDDNDDDDDEDEDEDRIATPSSSASFPAIQYLLDQCALILRRETSSLTTASFLPKTSTATLLTMLIGQLSAGSSSSPSPSPSSSLGASTLRKLLPPLVYLTDTQRPAPRSGDPTFKATYAGLTAAAQEVMSAVQEKIGDAAWVQAMTEASKMMRGRREERKRKRVVERIAEPEKAARAKRRKAERKVLRKREIGRMYADRRKGV